MMKSGGKGTVGFCLSAGESLEGVADNFVVGSCKGKNNGKSGGCFETYKLT